MSIGADRVLRLIRFSSARYIQDFVTGTLYLNTLGYYAQEESNPARSDVREGGAQWLQPETAKLAVKINGVFHHIPGICGPIRHTKDEDLMVNVFCMYALRTSHLAAGMPELIDPRNFSFGDTFAVITDGNEFLRRVRSAAESASHALECRLVEYVDESTYEGPIGPFRKSSAFSYQSEFRIALFPGTGDPYRLQIGDISDICVQGPLSEINRRITRVSVAG